MGSAILGMPGSQLGQIVLGSGSISLMLVATIASQSRPSTSFVLASAQTPTRRVAQPTTHPLASASAAASLGFGLLSPMQRNQHGDFASGGDVDLIRANVAEVLGIEGQTDSLDGELQWRPELGAQLTILKHRANDGLTAQIAQVYVGDALSRWVPRVRLKKVTTTPVYVAAQGGGPDGLILSLVYDIVASAHTNTVIAPNITQDVRV